MVGLDTNILVRYLAQDDVVQARQATQIIDLVDALEDLDDVQKVYTNADIEGDVPG